MNEWKLFSDVIENIPVNKYPNLSKLRLPVRYISRLRKCVGGSEESCGKVGKMYYGREVAFNIIPPNNSKKWYYEYVKNCEVFVDEKTMGKLFVWCMWNGNE